MNTRKRRTELKLNEEGKRVLGIKSFNFTLKNLKKINFEFDEDKELNAIHFTKLPQLFMEEVKNFGDLNIGSTFNERTTMVDLTTWYCTIALLWIPPPVNKCSN